MVKAHPQRTRTAYGPAAFIAALANILAIEVAVWIFLPWFLLAIYVLPLLLIDLALAAILKRRRGTTGQVGRGMLIGLLSAPAALLLFLPGLMLVQALDVV